MKNIELTEDHKSKLLEMCKVLFPEYNYYSLHKTDNILTFRSNYFYNHDDDWSYDEQLHIHWFEFCINYLSRKLYVKLDKRKHTHFLFNNTKGIVIYHENSIFTNYYLYFEKEHHLIDYLYEVFKKINIKNV